MYTILLTGAVDGDRHALGVVPGPDVVAGRRLADFPAQLFEFGVEGRHLLVRGLGHLAEAL